MQSFPHRFSYRRRSKRLSVSYKHACSPELTNMHWRCGANWPTHPLTFPSLLLLSVSVEQHRLFFFFSVPLSPSVFLFCTLFSLSQNSQCATLELQHSVVVQHSYKLLGADQWYHPIVPALSPAPRSMESGKERGGKERRKVEGKKRDRGWEGGRWRLEDCVVFLH